MARNSVRKCAACAETDRKTFVSVRCTLPSGSRKEERYPERASITELSVSLPASEFHDKPAHIKHTADEDCRNRLPQKRSGTGIDIRDDGNQDPPPIKALLDGYN